MNREGSPQLSLNLFADAIESGTSDSDMSYYLTYIRFLAEGHNKRDWLELTETEVYLLMIWYAKHDQTMMEKQALLTANAIGKALFGGQNE